MSSNFSVFGVISNSGPLGLLIWAMLFLLGIAGVIVGIFGIALKEEQSERLPLPFKLQLWFIAAILLTGTFGMTNAMVDAFAKLGTTTGCAKAQALHLAMIEALFPFGFSLLYLFLGSAFAAGSLIIHRKREFRIKLFKSMGLIFYLVIALLLFMITVALPVTLTGIEPLVTSKPDTQTIMHFGFPLKGVLILFLSIGIAGIILMLLLFFRRLLPRRSS